MPKRTAYTLVKINNDFGKYLNSIHKHRTPAVVIGKQMFIQAKSVSFPNEEFITINVIIDNDKQKGDFILTVPAENVEYIAGVGSAEKIEKVFGFAGK